MSVYNGEKYLREAVDSILGQTFTDFEFIIVDDGSTDGTEQILNSYTDARIVRIRNKHNVGLAISLNKGIAIARGEYIARMDADDISLPERLKHQAVYLSTHPDIGVLGTRIEIIDDAGNKLPNTTWHLGLPAESEIIRWRLFFESPMAHPSMLMRKALINSVMGYSVKDLYAEDYGLWVRLSQTTKLANLKEKLLLYRWHTSNASVLNRTLQKASHYKISNWAINEFAAQHSLNIENLPEPPPTESEEYDYQLIRTVFLLYLGFVRNVPLNAILKKKIRKDAAGRIFQLARNTKRKIRILPFIVLACWLDPSNINLVGRLLYQKFLAGVFPFKKVSLS